METMEAYYDVIVVPTL